MAAFLASSPPRHPCRGGAGHPFPPLGRRNRHSVYFRTWEKTTKTQIRAATPYIKAPQRWRSMLLRFTQATVHGHCHGWSANLKLKHDGVEDLSVRQSTLRAKAPMSSRLLWGCSSPSAVDLPPVGYTSDSHESFIVVYAVDHSILADFHPQPRPVRQFLRSLGIMLVGKFPDRQSNTSAGIGRKLTKGVLGRSADLNPVGQALSSLLPKE